MTKTSLRALLTLTVALPFLSLAGCGGDGGSDTPAVTPTPTTPTTPTTPATPGQSGFSVARCLSQTVGGQTVASLVVPDTLQITFANPSGFPNGRALPDPVIDVTLAVLFLDLTKHPATTLASIPINPAANDLPFRPAFPYLAAPQGTPPVASGAGSNFNFRTDAPSAYTRVDRMGMPAVATALVRSDSKTAYNDDNPAIDATGKWVPELTATLTGLTNALADDFARANLSTCATPN